MAVPIKVPPTYTLTTSPAPKGALKKPETKRPADVSFVSQLLLMVDVVVTPLSLVMLLKLTTCAGGKVSYSTLTWLLASYTSGAVAGLVYVSRLLLSAASLNLPASTPIVAVPVLVAAGVKVAV